MARLCGARLLTAAVPFKWWRAGLGPRSGSGPPPDARAIGQLAAHVERGAARLPFAVKCLPRAMALSWELRRRGWDHAVVIAVRPPALRGTGGDTLHAWVEHGGTVVLGALPGPWIELYRTESP